MRSVPLIGAAALLVAAIDPPARAPLAVWAAAAALAVTRLAHCALTGADVPPDPSVRMHAERGIHELACYLERHAEFAAYLNRRVGEERAPSAHPVGTRRAGAAVGDDRRMTTQSDIEKDSEGLGWRFWAGLVAVTLAIGLGLILAMILFGLAWYEWGFVGAAIVLIAVTCGIKALQDRRARRQWS